MGRKTEEPKSTVHERATRTVRIDTETVRKAGIIARNRRMTLERYLSDRVAPLVKEDFKALVLEVGTS